MKRKMMGAVLALATLTGCNAGVADVPDPATAEKAYFEFADTVFPVATTTDLMKVAVTTCAAIEGGSSRLLVLRVIGESVGDALTATEQVTLLELSVAYACPENIDFE